MLPVRSSALPADLGRDYGFWVEPWHPGIYVPGDEGPEQADAPWLILVDLSESQVTAKEPVELLGDGPEHRACEVGLLSQRRPALCGDGTVLNGSVTVGT